MALHCIELQIIALHCTTALQIIRLQIIALHWKLLHCKSLHNRLEPIDAAFQGRPDKQRRLERAGKYTRAA